LFNCGEKGCEESAIPFFGEGGRLVLENSRVNKKVIMNDSMMTQTYSEPTPPTISSSSQPEAVGKTPDDKRQTIRRHITERLVELIPAIQQLQVALKLA
jgi:hypothetical protein